MVHGAGTWVELAGVNVLCVPFTAEVAMAHHLAQVLSPEAVEPYTHLPCVLVTHVGVYDDGTAPWLKAKRDAIESGVLAAYARKFAAERSAESADENV